MKRKNSLFTLYFYTLFEDYKKNRRNVLVNSLINQLIYPFKSKQISVILFKNTILFNGNERYKIFGMYPLTFRVMYYEYDKNGNMIGVGGDSDMKYLFLFTLKEMIKQVNENKYDYFGKRSTPVLCGNKRDV